MTNPANATTGCLHVGEYVDEAECPTNLAFHCGEAVRPPVTMPYNDFSLETVTSVLGVSAGPADLFPDIIYSGQRLDVDPARGLVGECDFILSAAPPVPALRAPLVTIVEAKRNEVESGVWQCIAQMVGAREFNQQSGGGPEAIYGCVTNAETWRRCGGSEQRDGRLRIFVGDQELTWSAVREPAPPTPPKASAKPRAAAFGAGVCVAGGV